jgi:hypothetical protein
MKFGPFAVMSVFSDKFIRLLIFAAAVLCGVLFIVTTVVSLKPLSHPIRFYIARSTEDCIPRKSMLLAPLEVADSIKYTVQGQPGIMAVTTTIDSLPLPDTSYYDCKSGHFDSLSIYVRSNILGYAGVWVKKPISIPETLYMCLYPPKDSSQRLRSDTSTLRPLDLRFSTHIENYQINVIDTSLYKRGRVDISYCYSRRQSGEFWIVVCDGGCKPTANAGQLSQHESSQKLDSILAVIILGLLGERKAKDKKDKQDSLVLGSLISHMTDSTDSTRRFLRDVYDSAYDAVAKNDSEMCIRTVRDYARRHFREESLPCFDKILGRFVPGAVDTRTLRKVYYDEYSQQEWRRKKLERILTFLGAPSLFAVIATLIYIVFLKKPFEKLGKKVNEWMAGWRIFNWIGRRRYLRSVAKKYGEVKIPYGNPRTFPMTDIYVPLRGKGYNISENIDIFQELKRQTRIMITGAPGAGKSMLLNRIAFDLVQRETEPVVPNCIPVIVELQEVTEVTRDAESLVQHLEKAFKQHKFPNAKHFILRNLEKGRLMLLLDGLDEVPGNYDLVVQGIKNLLDTYDRCPAIVTCRTAVYRDEFRNQSHRHLEVASFSDKDIYRFLSNWENEMPPDKSVNLLIHHLDDYPKIKLLATNPLLLTIMTCLYVDDPKFELPRSRSEFYNESTQWLLEQWDRFKNKRNKYSGAKKHNILQHLALNMLDASMEKGEVRGIIEEEKAIRIVRNEVPDVGLDDADASPILDEIVERSGLLLKVDGGRRYQFVHLSLQEYFAACRLEDDVDGLLRRFRANPDGWREVVKLWCGSKRDSSKVIEQIFDEDSKTAFECIADATKVDDALVYRIVCKLQEKLWEDEEHGPIVLAFGLVAADAKPRGQKVFEFLKDALITSDSVVRRSRAAFALAATKRSAAVEVLAEEYMKLEEARRALESMGNLAVKGLERMAAQGSLMAVDSLASIGTPPTLEALVRILYFPRTEVAERAAWRLANMLQQIEVEKQLDGYQLDPAWRVLDDLNWVWEPHVSASAGSLKPIVGRIAYLIKNTPVERLREIDLPIDARIAVPLALEQNLLHLKSELKSRPAVSPGYDSLLSQITNLAYTRLRELVLHRAKLRLERDQADEALSEEIIKSGAISDHLKKFVSGLSSTEQVDLFGLLLAEKNIPNHSDWQNLRPQLARYGYSIESALSQLLFAKRRLSQSISYLLVLSFFVIMSLASFIQLPVTVRHNISVYPIGYIGWIIGVAVIAAGWIFFVFDRKHISIKYPRDFFNYGVRGIFYVPQKYIFSGDVSGFTDVRLALIYVCFMVWFLALVCNAWTLVWNTIGANYVTICLFVSFVVALFWDIFGFPSVFKEDESAFAGLVPILSILYRFTAKP